MAKNTEIGSHLLSLSLIVKMPTDNDPMERLFSHILSYLRDKVGGGGCFR